jgi:hypothetical protein
MNKSQEFRHFISFGSDPQLLLPLYITRTELSTAATDLSAAQAELKCLAGCGAKFQELEQALQQVLSSYSWRMTEPVRDVMLFLRKRLRNR